MNRVPKFLALALLLALSAQGLSITVVGKWSGHFVAKLIAPPGNKALSPDAVKQINEFMAQIRISLTISKDGSYLAITKGPKQPDATTKGKWTLKGKVLTLTPNEKRPPEIGTLSANGKTLTMSLPKSMSEHGVTGHAVFNRS